MTYDPALHLRWSKQVSFGYWSECWPWIGASVQSKKTPSYRWGVISVRGQAKKATRVGWSLLFGPIPDGQQLLHSCDNPLCVNPGHLFLGTPTDNVRDMDRKGRRRTYAVSGERHHNSRLTSEQVAQIRESTLSTRALMARFSLSQVTIDRIRRGISRRNG